ncbi:MAG: hypothetical protein ACLS3M_02440 [Collinsella sp.]
MAIGTAVDMAEPITPNNLHRNIEINTLITAIAAFMSLEIGIHP